MSLIGALIGSLEAGSFRDVPEEVAGAAEDEEKGEGDEKEEEVFHGAAGLHGHAAVDGEDLAGDVAGRGAGDEEDAVGDVIDGTEVGEGDFGDDAFFELV